jgi:hypothetical protein
MLTALNLTQEENRNRYTAKVEVKYSKPYSKYEISASPRYESTIIDTKEGKEVLTIKYENGQTSKPIAITSWGGYAMDNSFLLSIADENYWTIDPFKFLKDTLRLDEIPVPDPTTESGRRILFIHVDGDGFVERVRTDVDRLSTEHLIEHIYKKYQIPQTVSLIQGEVESLLPKLAPKMKKISKELYSIPWIEPASHTLSHPFKWNEVIKPEHADPKIGKKYHLPIPNYHFTLEKETLGSINFALSFAPKNKSKEKILFWSGDCIPPKEVLAFIERKGILAMNGGDTTISKSYPWLGHIAPFGLQREEYWQIYTAQQNENVYTNEWLGPFWGYRGVIETFEMTEKPRRLKPINIYYHFYSGSKVASLNALNEVYSWAIEQKTAKLYASQYIKKARGFYRTAIGKIDGGYEIRNSGYLRTIRFDKRVSVEIDSSQGVAGFINNGERTYITLDRGQEYKIKLTKYNIDTPYLIDSNGWVEKFSHKRGEYSFKLESNVAVEANFYLPTSCRATMPIAIKITENKNRLSLVSSQKGVVVAFKCK